MCGGKDTRLALSRDGGDVGRRGPGNLEAAQRVPQCDPFGVAEKIVDFCEAEQPPEREPHRSHVSRAWRMAVASLERLRPRREETKLHPAQGDVRQKRVGAHPGDEWP